MLSWAQGRHNRRCGCRISGSIESRMSILWTQSVRSDNAYRLSDAHPIALILTAQRYFDLPGEQFDAAVAQRIAQLAQGPLLELSRPLLADAQFVADFFQR